MTEDKFIGCLLGVAVGDSLGAAVEFNTRQEIESRYGGPIVDIDECGYTDDTEMTLALADSIIEKGLVDPEHCAASYVKAWGSPPYRGYGPSVMKSLYSLSIGVSWKHSGRVVHPDGSYGNGGAMRIAPVALVVSGDELCLYDAVKDALVCTHDNEEAVEAAFIQALAIQQAGDGW